MLSFLKSCKKKVCELQPAKGFMLVYESTPHKAMSLKPYFTGEMDEFLKLIYQKNFFDAKYEIYASFEALWKQGVSLSGMSREGAYILELNQPPFDAKMTAIDGKFHNILLRATSFLDMLHNYQHPEAKTSSKGMLTYDKSDFVSGHGPTR